MKGRTKKLLGPAYVIYPPPLHGLPFLAVLLKPDGSVLARPFFSVDEAIAFNNSASEQPPN
ncbi:hypothetical protein [Mesorhizobium sp. INR15]|uniref:hypothetical protein n=1 Tax=Mesorhizobium sp. INR15 TaxID=2654248 RepID=UPI0018968E21|nr:hypothetical protein [Mesorhizobium sp. INR15]QPC91510.1 hypothetical protein GA829_13315 [Mesorhizobium sp. INR15]